ncbi:MAG: universal stress protein [Jatrophihabitans sp.]|nr:MAG: universal stress protein [Jatrophihabitans sp.]
MTDLVTLADGGPVSATAQSLAEVLRARVRPVPVEGGLDDADLARRLVAALGDPGAVAGALAAPGEPDAPGWSVIARADKPVLLVPPHTGAGRARIGRALLPLDGRPESAQAVREFAALLDLAGVRLLVLHVFDATTVPLFWDQRTHAHSAWTAEFLHRCGTPPGTRIELRSGVPAEHVHTVARAEDVDLIVLGWSRVTGAGRARTVRESVLYAPAPVVLLPVGPASGTGAAGAAADAAG